MKLAFIGTGVMGSAMALNLAKAGHDVHVYNRTRSKALALEPNCKCEDSIALCVKGADVIFSIVGFVKDVEEIYFADYGILANAEKGAILCDMTTSSPDLAIHIYEQAKSRGLFSLDAPVTGGDKGAKEATLSIMVGGDKDIFDKVLPLFKHMGQAVNYLGEAGSGQYMKLSNQLAIAGALSGIAEALSFAESKGLDTETVLDVIVNGSAESWQARNNGPKMLNKDYAPGFFIKHFIKDLSLAQEAASGLNLKIASETLKSLRELADKGHEDLGTQALIEYYRNN